MTPNAGRSCRTAPSRCCSPGGTRRRSTGRTGLRRCPNCQYWTIAHRVVALTKLGRRADASAAVRSLLRQCPEFTLEFARRKLFYLKRPEQLELYLGGLAEAGVPDG